MAFADEVDASSRRVRVSEHVRETELRIADLERGITSPVCPILTKIRAFGELYSAGKEVKSPEMYFTLDPFMSAVSGAVV